nr:glycosyltransferase [Butyrivibrio sp.]
NNCKVRYLSDSEYNRKAIKEIINEIHPDVLYLQSFFEKCVIPVTYYANKYHIKEVLAPRGEMCEGALRIKSYKKRPYLWFVRKVSFFSKVIFQSTSSDETVGINKYLNVPKSNIYELDNIPSIPEKDYINNIKNVGQANIAYISRIAPVKNLFMALNAMRPINSDIVFDIYGPLEDKEYWSKCSEIIASLPSNVKVSYMGAVKYEKVREILSSYDAFILPTFGENYGHAIAEALSIGCPVIISDKTPWTEVMNEKAGWVSGNNDTAGYTKAIEELAKMDNEELNLYRKNAKAFFKKKTDLEKLREDYSLVFGK